MKGDMDFDECQMRVLEMGVISQGLRAALKHCVSGFHRCGFGKCCIGFICPCESLCRQGGLRMAVAAQQSSVRLTAVTVMQAVAANGTAETFRRVRHQSGSSATLAQMALLTHSTQSRCPSLILQHTYK
ncbi:hypothetical protein CesoFtcFv8_025821 [Champsocephalus esox]|uniref:Uncharacterized protein n=1 Tax=Champsocephalus esox TaxID=159716 RepID=A0AAN8B1J8_9TELE|nr:hypothetical protein CesoFtcFv8_025821 [Champsocephalus esox]